jgi:hypothetical protein
MRFLQILIDGLWAREPEPPSTDDDVRTAVCQLRERLGMTRSQFARYCRFPDSVISRLEGATGFKLDDYGRIEKYASASPGVFLRLVSIAGELCYPKHVAYFQRQAAKAFERSHAPRRGVER